MIDPGDLSPFAGLSRSDLNLELQRARRKGDTARVNALLRALKAAGDRSIGPTTPVFGEPTVAAALAKLNKAVQKAPRGPESVTEPTFQDTSGYGQQRKFAGSIDPGAIAAQIGETIYGPTIPIPPGPGRPVAFDPYQSRTKQALGEQGDSTGGFAGAVTGKDPATALDGLIRNALFGQLSQGVYENLLQTNPALLDLMVSTTMVYLTTKGPGQDAATLMADPNIVHYVSTGAQAAIKMAEGADQGFARMRTIALTGVDDTERKAGDKVLTELQSLKNPTIKDLKVFAKVHGLSEGSATYSTLESYLSSGAILASRSGGGGGGGGGRDLSMSPLDLAQKHLLDLQSAQLAQKIAGGGATPQELKEFTQRVEEFAKSFALREKEYVLEGKKLVEVQRQNRMGNFLTAQTLMNQLSMGGGLVATKDIGRPFSGFEEGGPISKVAKIQGTPYQELKIQGQPLSPAFVSLARQPEEVPA